VDGDEAKRLLDEEKGRLANLHAGVADEHVRDRHMADVASDTLEREKDFSVLEQVEAELADVERALQRLDDGTYGQCDACGQPIADERLAAMPATRFCVAHRVEAEPR
jgi:RNA polymerase-binding transcription factor DksA